MRVLQAVSEVQREGGGVMSATDELRRLLDERGVEWYEPTMKPNTTWFPDAYGINCRVKPWGDVLQVKRYGLTPEQAIAATLGDKPHDKTEEWLLKACNQATQDYVKALEKLVQDWQVLYDEPDYGDYYRLRKRMQDLGIEVIDE